MCATVRQGANCNSVPTLDAISVEGFRKRFEPSTTPLLNMNVPLMYVYVCLRLLPV